MRIEIKFDAEIPDKLSDKVIERMLRDIFIKMMTTASNLERRALLMDIGSIGWRKK